MDWPVNIITFKTEKLYIKKTPEETMVAPDICNGVLKISTNIKLHNTYNYSHLSLGEGTWRAR